MLNLIVIKVRRWSCYDVISASPDTPVGGDNLLNGPCHKSCTFGFMYFSRTLSEPAQHTL